MAAIFIYGDESGTMPIKQSDGPFVACCVATLNEIPAFDASDGKISWIFESLKEYDAIPHFSYVVPGIEFDDRFKSRMSKMNTMARMTRLMNGMNKQYLTEDGFCPRNYVWIRSMSTSIGQVLVEKILRHRIDAINILLDQKSFAIPNRHLFTKQIADIEKPLIRTLQRVRAVNPAAIQRVSRNVKFAGNITIEWSDSPSVSASTGGLFLADKLAGKFLRGLKSGQLASSPLVRKLGEYGFKDYSKDITKEFLELNKDAVEDWKRNTGLPEPQA